MATEETKPKTKDPEVKDDAEGSSDDDKGKYGPTLMALLADADVNAVLQAKRAQKSVRVVVSDDGEAAPEDEDEDSEVEVEDDELETDPSQKKAIDRVMKALDKKLKPLGARIEGLEGLAKDLQKGGVQREVASVKKKYEDFAKYQKPILELSKTFPGASVEELYLIAKARAGDLVVPQPSTFSEKPTEARITRKSGGKERKEAREREVKAGTRGFRTMLQEVLSDMEFDL